MQHLAVDPDEPSPPATSPIATAAPSQRPCIRTRGAKGGKGGKAKKTSRLIKRWQKDFDFFADWLCRESGEFWTHYRQYEDSNSESIWTLTIFRVLLRNCFSDSFKLPTFFHPAPIGHTRAGIGNTKALLLLDGSNKTLLFLIVINLQAFAVFQTT